MPKTDYPANRSWPVYEDIIDLDWMLDAARAAAEFGYQAYFLRNFNPVAVMLQGSPEDVNRATRNYMKASEWRSIS